MMFKIFRRNAIDFDSLLEEFKNTDNAYLIDVREIEEYAQGHVPTSINIPLSQIDKIEKVVKNKDSSLYVYCLSGARSRNAVSFLKSKGYTNVINLGGINSYHGEIER